MALDGLPIDHQYYRYKGRLTAGLLFDLLDSF